MSQNTVFEDVKPNTPKGINILHQSPDMIELNLQATSISRRILIALMGLAGIGAITYGMLTEQINFILGIVLFFAAAMAAKVAATIRSTFRFRVTPEVVSIKGKNYRRSMWQGFRQGEARDGNRVIDLMLVYGGTTTKTGILLPTKTIREENYIATINYLNAVVESIPVSGGETSTVAALAGKREQMF